MTFGKLLTRQLKRVWGARDPAQIDAILTVCSGAGEPDATALLAALPAFLQMVDAAYAQNERDLDLKTRSLQLSSVELNQANERLRAEADSQTKALESLRATVQKLVGAGNTGAVAAPEAASDSIEDMSTMILRLAEDRGAAQELLMQSEAKFRSLTELSSDWYWEQDASFRYVERSTASDTQDRGLAMPVATQLIGLRRWEISGHEPVIGSWEDHQKILSAKQPFHDFRVRRVDKNGEERVVSLSGTPVMAADGTFSGYRGVGSEITASIRAQREIERAHRFMSAVIDAGPSPIFVKDEQYRWIILNDAMCNFMGHRREELLGKNDFDIFPEKEARVFRARDEMVFASGQADENEESFTAADGTAHWILTRKRAYDLADGKRILVGVIADITEIKSKETALRESEARANRLALVASRTHSLVLIMDSRGRIEWANDAFTAVTGYSLDEVAGRAPGDALSGPDTDPVEAARIGKLILDGKHFQAELVYYSKSGRKYWMAIDAQALRDDDGRVTNYIAINSDITARKETEQALRDAKAAAEAANRAKSEFVANMSHEIRTPMNGVMGMTELLLDTKLDEKQCRYAKNIQNSADALLNIINDVLDCSKIEAGKMELDPVDFDVRTLAGAVAEMASGLAKAKGIEVSWQVTDAVPAWLRGDIGRLRQVLTNLVSNAIKFTERGKVLLEVRPAPEAGVARADEACLLEFSITDTGIGIPEEVKKRLFTAFTQADGSTTRRFGGTGLGLAISRQLVTLMGGAIDVASTPGRGSRFWFTVQLQAAMPEPAPVPVPLAVSATQGVRGGRVLLVEDNIINQEVALAMLESAGYRVEVASDGAEALHKCAEARFDCVLMDCQMPVMDGFQATQRIRTREAENGSARLPIVALTANAMAGDRERCLAAGMDDFLSKPFDARSLLEAVARGAARAAPETAPETTPAAAPASFDPTAFEDLIKLDRETPGFLARLTGRFLQTTPALIASIASASDETIQDVERTAHTLKSTSARFGAHALAQLATQAEAAAREGRLDTARELGTAMRREFERVSQALATHLESLAARAA